MWLEEVLYEVERNETVSSITMSGRPSLGEIPLYFKSRLEEKSQHYPLLHYSTLSAQSFKDVLITNQFNG